MTATKDGIEVTVETERLHYIKYTNGTIFTNSVKLRAVFLGKPDIKGISFNEWASRILDDKILVESSVELSDEFNSIINDISPREDPYLIVGSIEDEYLLKTFFNILTSLLEEGSEIKSLEWIK